jgi:hypothetical protein
MPVKLEVGYPTLRLPRSCEAASSWPLFRAALNCWAICKAPRGVGQGTTDGSLEGEAIWTNNKGSCAPIRPVPTRATTKTPVVVM